MSTRDYSNLPKSRCGCKGKKTKVDTHLRCDPSSHKKWSESGNLICDAGKKRTIQGYTRCKTTGRLSGCAGSRPRPKESPIYPNPSK